MAALLYQPWNSAPFSILDFSEFLPILAGSRSLGSAVADLASYYAVHGRSTLLAYAYIAFNWELFGPDPKGWDVLRFVLMLTNVVLFYTFLRRAGSSVTAAFIPAVLLVTATGAIGAWLRLTGEMLTMLCLLLAAHIALGYQNARHWRAQAILFAALLAAAILAKETTAVLVPLALLFVCCRGHVGRQQAPLRTARNVWIVLATAVAVLGVGLLIMSTVGAATETAYVRAYGGDDRAMWRFAGSWRHFALPISVGDFATVMLLQVAFVVVVIAGWAIRFRQAQSRRRVLLEAGFLVSFILMGMLAYMPWPRIEAFYLYPFLLGPLFLLSVGVQQLESIHGTRRTVLLGVVLLLPSLVQAYNGAQESDSIRRLNAKVAQTLPRLPADDTLIVAVRGLAEQRWAGTGPTLRRYALATGADEPLPSATEMVCPHVRQRLEAGPWKATILSYGHLCGPLFSPSFSVSSISQRFEPFRLRFATFEHRADFFLGGNHSSAPGH